MGEERAPTLKELRELRGLSLEELADRTRIPQELLVRWEEIGIDAAPCTWKADFWADEELSVILEVLDADSVRPKFAPTSPEPGEIVIDTPDSDLLDLLIDRGAELRLRVAIPTEKWGIVLKYAHDLTDADIQAIADYEEAKTAYLEERIKCTEAYMNFLKDQPQGTIVDEAIDAANE